jgi:hypothetical protein
VLAYAWGDMLTDIIQPFWAIPLLAIARLSFRDIMGYGIVFFLAYAVIVALGSPHGRLRMNPHSASPSSCCSRMHSSSWARSVPHRAAHRDDASYGGGARGDVAGFRRQPVATWYGGILGWASTRIATGFELGRLRRAVLHRCAGVRALDRAAPAFAGADDPRATPCRTVRAPASWAR